ncbi:Transducin/WD40 repeat-like superfamily protein isoform 1 [Hibiscus syriacus]|uniref:Transducin/WD40 repeat-like superfamily protein isoform 1 n=1 Tax=Hibiscus syriacus TaxID=106335 RepID=A0A6A3CY40_HIBSY|nr:Transducin/WD40 repeat-like superfamily protein isoform 1 [Hibiscus syriacus]
MPKDYSSYCMIMQRGMELSSPLLDRLLVPWPLANLAAHGDSNSNNAAIGQEEGALEALMQLTYSQNEGVRKLLVLCGISFDDKNREAIAAAGGVETLHCCIIYGDTSIAIGSINCGFMNILYVTVSAIAFGPDYREFKVDDVHETAAGALWNSAFYRENALHIVQDALVYIFDGRIDASGSSKTLNMDGVGRIALKHVEGFVNSFYDPQSFHTAASSLVPTALAQIDRRSHKNTRSRTSKMQGRIQICNRHRKYLASKMQVHLESTWCRCCITTPIQAKIYAKIVLRNLERPMNSQTLALSGSWITCGKEMKEAQPFSSPLSTLHYGTTQAQALITAQAQPPVLSRHSPTANHRPSPFIFKTLAAISSPFKSSPLTPPFPFTPSDRSALLANAPSSRPALTVRGHGVAGSDLNGLSGQPFKATASVAVSSPSLGAAVGSFDPGIELPPSSPLPANIEPTRAA